MKIKKTLSKIAGGKAITEDDIVQTIQQERARQ